MSSVPLSMSLESGWLRAIRLVFSSPRSSMGEKHTPLGILWEEILSRCFVAVLGAKSAPVSSRLSRPSRFAICGVPLFGHSELAVVDAEDVLSDELDVLASDFLSFAYSPVRSSPCTRTGSPLLRELPNLVDQALNALRTGKQREAVPPRPTLVRSVKSFAAFLRQIAPIVPV